MNSSTFPLNAVIPYFTMFPLKFPLGILERLKRCLISGGVIFDPFCGRGTTNFAARIVGGDTIGIDCNKVAVAATQAKLVNVDPTKVVELASSILSSNTNVEIPDGEFWGLAYEASVLQNICRFRSAFLEGCKSPTEIALRAVIAGGLHGPRRKHGHSYFSNQSPRTYAPKPRYAVKFWERNSLRPPKVDMLQVIKERVHRYYGRTLPNIEFQAICGDSRNRDDVRYALAGNRAQITITSPPYYGMNTYGADQWIRSWFLGANPEVDYSYGNQVSHRCWRKFSTDLRTVWLNVAEHSLPNARLVIRFGGINDRSQVCPKMILRHSLDGTPWTIKTIRSAGLATRGKQQARSFLKTSQMPIPEYDFYCAMS